MLVRKPTLEECTEVLRIRDMAFLRTRPADARPVYTQEAADLDRCAFDDTGRMVATLVLHDFTCSFEGQPVHLGGIGGVATLAEARRNGAVRALMESALREMYASGYLFSGLYPFSHEFYRKFGYELCVSKTVATLPIDGIKRQTSEGFITQHRPDQPIDDIKAVYQAFTADANFVIQRGDRAWARWQQDAHEAPYYAYRWHNAAGETRAYILYTPRKVEGEEPTLVIADMAWCDAQALDGLLGFLTALNPSYEKVELRVPDCLNPYQLAAEPYIVSLSVEPAGMLRVVNAQRVLEGMQRPATLERFTLSIMDPVIAENNGVFRVTLGPDTAQVIRDEDAAPDAQLSIQTLAQLVSGAFTPDQLINSGGFKVFRNLGAIRRVFVRRPVHFVEYF